MPGCIATLVNVTVPSRRSTSLTVSYAPALTPPVVTSRSARMTWSSIAPSTARGLVDDDADAVRVRAELGGGRGQPVPVGLVDLPRRQRLPRLDQLAAGREHDDPRPGAHLHPVAADGREQRDVPRRQARARRRPRARPARTSSPARRTYWPSAGDRSIATAVVAAVRPLDRDDGVRAGRHRRAGHDPQRRAPAPGRGRPGARPAMSPDHRQHHRRRRARRRRPRPRGRRNRPSRSCRTAAGRSPRRRPRPGGSRPRRAAAGRSAAAARPGARHSRQVLLDRPQGQLPVPAGLGGQLGHELAQPAAQLGAQVAALGGEPDDGLEVVEAVAGVVPAAAEHDAVDAAALLARPLAPAPAARR